MVHAAGETWCAEHHARSRALSWAGVLIRGPGLSLSYLLSSREVLRDYFHERSASHEDPADHDSSEESELAATTAAELAEGTDSELHVVTVGPYVSTFLAVTEEEPGRTAREARKTLDDEVALIEGTVYSLGNLQLRACADRRVANVSMDAGEPI